MKKFEISVDPMTPLDYERVLKEIFQPLQKFIRENGIGDLLVEPGSFSVDLCRGKAFGIGRDPKDSEFPNLEFTLLKRGRGRATLYEKPNLMFVELNGPKSKMYSGTWFKILSLVIAFFQKEARKQKSTADQLRKIQTVIKGLNN